MKQSKIIDTSETYQIPREGLMRPIMSLDQDPPRLVSELINMTTASWREDVIRTVFLLYDADAILAIPLCTRNVSYFWSWSGERRVNFLVKSAYRLILNTKLNRENWLEEIDGPSNMTTESKAWMSLWKMKVPSKLKVFL